MSGAAASPDERKLLVLVSGQLYAEIMSPRAEESLSALGEVIRWRGEGRVTADQIEHLVPGVEAIVTGWGAAPTFDARLLEKADRLRIIGHTAGSIKSFIPPEVLERGIAVTTANSAIADSVGEWVLMVTLLALRRAFHYITSVHAGRGWDPCAIGFGNELYRKRVGIVSAGATGRAFIRLLKPFDVDVLVYDPYLSDERAGELGELGVRRAATLDELFATCDVVSNHAPTTAETTGMIGAAQFARLRDGALFVNTARAASVEYDALTRELESGRIQAALDVFPKEPLAPDSTLRGLPNVLLSPHAAGPTVVESRRRLGETIADEFACFFAGEPLRHRVTQEMLATMA